MHSLYDYHYWVIASSFKHRRATSPRPWSYTHFQLFLTQYHHGPHKVIRAATSPSSPIPKAHCGEGQLTIWSSLVLIWWMSQATSVPKFHSLSLTLCTPTLSVSKQSYTRSTQLWLAKMGGGESEKNIFLCESIRARKFKTLHQQWNIANLQAMLQSGDESQNANASANTEFNLCTNTRILY